MMKDLRRKTLDISAGTIWRVVLVVLFVWFLFLIRETLFLLFFAIVVVSAAQPIVDKLEKKKIPRTISAVTIYLFILFVIGLVLYFLIPILLVDLKKLGENLPIYLQGLDQFIRNITEIASTYKLEENLNSIIDNSTSKIADTITSAFSNTLGFLGGFFKVIVVISLSFYMLVKKDGIKGFLQTIVPTKHQVYAINLVTRIQAKIGRWLIGQFTLIILIACLDYLALHLLDVPFALMLAVIGGIFEIVPYIGPTIAIVPAVLVGLTVSPLTGILVVVVYILIQQLENHVFTPLIMRKAVGLNPVVVILALLVGSKLAGVIGIIIAVPLATAIGIFMKDLVNNNTQ
ncbi:MAG: AI-2E family transporter [Patescibacteria group bacterium]|nr:AI-2E family transporter [Patescibacteria group bacterium]